MILIDHMVRKSKHWNNDFYTDSYFEDIGLELNGTNLVTNADSYMNTQNTMRNITFFV